MSTVAIIVHGVTSQPPRPDVQPIGQCQVRPAEGQCPRCRSDAQSARLCLPACALWPLSAASPVMPVQRGQGRHGRRRPDRVRRHDRRGVQGPHPRRARKRHGPQPQPDPGAARGRAAGHHRRHRRDERQPGLHRRPPGRRRLVLPRRRSRASRSPASRRSTRWSTRRAAPAAGPSARRARAELSLPLSSASLAATLQQVFARTNPFAQSPADVRFAGVSAGTWAARELGAMLRPIATPLVMGGFRGEIADLVSSGFAASGFTPMTTGGAADPSATADRAAGAGRCRRRRSGERRPGRLAAPARSPPSMARASTRSATRSTTSARRRFPMTRAWIHTLLPSLMNSSKLGSLGEVIGTFDQDRATAIAGTLGAAPSMLPITLVLDTDRGPSRTFHFSVVRDQLFTPLLTYLSVVNTLQVVRARVRHVELHGQGPGAGRQARRDRLRRSRSPATRRRLARPATSPARSRSCSKNDFEPVEINTLDLTIVSSESPRTAVLERVWLDAPRGAARPLGAAQAAGAHGRGRRRAAHGQRWTSPPTPPGRSR